jgi:hypothetical protein
VPDDALIELWVITPSSRKMQILAKREVPPWPRTRTYRSPTANPCRRTPPLPGNYGSVGSISNSCTGFESCYHVGRGGSVGSIHSSCNSPFRSCHSAGSGNIVNDDGAVVIGTVGSISESCNNVRACFAIGSYNIDQFVEKNRGTGPVTLNLVNCCNTDEECLAKNEAS